MTYAGAAAAFGKRLRNKRERLGLSRQQLANLGGVHLSVQGRYERGESVPNSTYLQTFINAGGDYPYLFDCSDSPSAPEASVQAVNTTVEFAERMWPEDGGPIDKEALYEWIASLDHHQLLAVTTLLVNKAIRAEFKDDTNHTDKGSDQNI